jgi:hypothetical protein
LKAKAASADVVVLGDSHALYGINPQYFDLKGINLANISQSIFYDTQILKDHLSQMNHLKVVVFTLSYFTLGYDLRDSKEAWREYYYWRFMNIKAPGLKPDLKLASYILLYSWPKVQDYIKEGFKEPLVKGISELGWQIPEKANSMAQDQFGKNRVDFHTKLINRKNLILNETYLQNTLAMLNQRGIKTLFIRMPVSPNYFQYTNSEIYARDTRMIQSLCETYGCTFFDGQKLGYAQDFFADDDHLNTKGSKEFSQLVNLEIHKLSTNER